MSPTLKPAGKGSVSSSTQVARPVIHPLPVIVGRTASYGPSRVVPSSSPTNSVPMVLRWLNF